MLTKSYDYRNTVISIKLIFLLFKMYIHVHTVVGNSGSHIPLMVILSSFFTMPSRSLELKDYFVSISILYIML